MVLKPCSETERDSSNLEEASMVEDSSQRKRKAEVDPEEESDREKEEGGWSEDDKIDLLEVPQWDVDSFDGVVYSSSSDPDLPPCYQPYENMENAREHYRISKKQLITSKGFMVDPTLRPSDRYLGIKPLGFNDGGQFREHCEEMVSVCLEKYNQEMGLNVEFVEVVRGNYRGGPRPKSYITFMAREKPDGPLVEYQAKGMATLDRKMHPIICRPAPTQMPPNQEDRPGKRAQHQKSR